MYRVTYESHYGPFARRGTFNSRYFLIAWAWAHAYCFFHTWAAVYINRDS